MKHALRFYYSFSLLLFVLSALFLSPALFAQDLHLLPDSSFYYDTDFQCVYYLNNACYAGGTLGRMQVREVGTNSWHRIVAKAAGTIKVMCSDGEKLYVADDHARLYVYDPSSKKCSLLVSFPVNGGVRQMTLIGKDSLLLLFDDNSLIQLDTRTHSIHVFPYDAISYGAPLYLMSNPGHALHILSSNAKIVSYVGADSIRVDNVPQTQALHSDASVVSCLLDSAADHWFVVASYNHHSSAYFQFHGTWQVDSTQVGAMPVGCIGTAADTAWVVGYDLSFKQFALDSAVHSTFSYRLHNVPAPGQIQWKQFAVNTSGMLTAVGSNDLIMEGTLQFVDWNVRSYLPSLSVSAQAVNTSTVIYPYTSSWIYRTVDAGLRWSVSSCDSAGATMRSVDKTYVINDSTFALIVPSANSQAVYTTIDTGRSFTKAGELSSEVNPVVQSLSRWFGLRRGVVFVTSDAGVAWDSVTVFSPLPYAGSYPTLTQVLYFNGIDDDRVLVQYNADSTSNLDASADRLYTILVDCVAHTIDTLRVDTLRTLQSSSLRSDGTLALAYYSSVSTANRRSVEASAPQDFHTWQNNYGDSIVQARFFCTLSNSSASIVAGTIDSVLVSVDSLKSWQWLRLSSDSISTGPSACTNENDIISLVHFSNASILHLLRSKYSVDLNSSVPGMAELHQHALSVHPNPLESITTITVGSDELASTPPSCRLITILGIVVVDLSSLLHYDSNRHCYVAQWNSSSLAAGSYLLVAQSAFGKSSQLVVKP